jgi:uncharacterized protein
VSLSEREDLAAPTDATLVSEQIGRTPRGPWRVGARCSFDHPTVIVSPSKLADGTPFPTYAWLTCPHLVEQVGAAESAGDVSAFAARVAAEPALREALIALDRRVRDLRTAESGGEDTCPGVGIGGQRDPLGVKCLHVHVALALLGEADPIGTELLGFAMSRECDDDRCAGLAHAGSREED